MQIDFSVVKSLKFQSGTPIDPTKIRKTGSYESLDNLPLVNILVPPEMVLLEKMLNLLYKVMMKDSY